MAAYDIAAITDIIGRNLGVGRVALELGNEHFRRAIDAAYKLLSRYYPQYGYQILAVQPNGTKYRLAGSNILGVTSVTAMHHGTRFEEAPYYTRWVDRSMELGDMRDTQLVFGDEFEWSVLSEQDPVTYDEAWWVYVHFTRSTFLDTFARIPTHACVQFTWAIQANDERTQGVGRTPADIRQWIEDYATARARSILGDVRGKFGGLPGSSDGSVLPTDGPMQVQRAEAAIAKLEEDLVRRARQLPITFF